MIAYPEAYQIPTGHFINQVTHQLCHAFLEVRSGFLFFSRRVKLINKLCPIELNFGKDLDVSSKTVKGICTAVSVLLSPIIDCFY